jgi:hypothetical protein
MRKESPMIAIWEGDKLIGLEIHQETATQPEPTMLEKELVKIFTQNKKLKEALSPFVSFKIFLDALIETQNEKPLTEHSSIVQIMGSGGSDNIWYGDLIKAAAAFKAVS